MRLKFGFLLVICALLGDTLAVGREEQEARIVENKGGGRYHCPEVPLAIKLISVTASISGM